TRLCPRAPILPPLCAVPCELFPDFVTHSIRARPDSCQFPPVCALPRSTTGVARDPAHPAPPAITQAPRGISANKIPGADRQEVPPSRAPASAAVRRFPQHPVTRTSCPLESRQYAVAPVLRATTFSVSFAHENNETATGRRPFLRPARIDPQITYRPDRSMQDLTPACAR